MSNFERIYRDDMPREKLDGQRERTYQIEKPHALTQLTQLEIPLDLKLKAEVKVENKPVEEVLTKRKYLKKKNK